MPSYLLRVRERFEAAHHLTSYRGRPEPVHGHSWVVEAVVETEELDEEGIGVDFVALRDELARLAARFDHGDVNAVPPFDGVSPTTERLAAWFHDRLAEWLAGRRDASVVPCRLAEVTLWEGPSAAATYRP